MQIHFKLHFIHHRIQPIKTITFYFFDTGYFLNYYNWIERGVLTTDDVERSYFTGEEQCLKGVENLSLEIGQIRSKINLFFKNLKNLRQLTLNLLSPDEDPEKLFEPKELQKLKEIPKLTTIAVNERYLNKWSEIFKRNNMDYDIITIENE